MKCGLYDESYKIAADTNLLVNYLYNCHLKVAYLPEFVTRMRMGGMSTDSAKRKKVWDEDNKAIIDAINAANPDLLWIGMTAPKQEKWTYSHWNELNIHCHVGTIGAVFDFFAGTVERAPIWWQDHGLEWLYRLMKEPKRMWRRYIIGNSLFLWNMVKEA